MRVVVMGVTGSGKTTVGLRLAGETRAEFADGDDFHAPDAVAKMAANVPLDDDDRWPWLDRVGEWLASGDERVVACSALKRSYRDAIRAHAPDAIFIHLWAEQHVLEDRVRRRAKATGHFAGPGLLDSQYAALEKLEPDEVGASIDVTSYSPEGAVLIARATLDAAKGRRAD
jgi:carbohydrate kinase (thermoresistant glucokinase family)